MFQPKETIRGVVEQISYPIVSNNNLGSDTLYAIITIRGTRQPLTTEVSSIEVLGINALGLTRFGG